LSQVFRKACKRATVLIYFVLSNAFSKGYNNWECTSKP